MQSFCLEIKTTCHGCGNPIPINALIEEIYCDTCNCKNVLSPKLWENLISENLTNAENFEDGEGQNSKIFTGEYEFSLLYGKQKARCPKCKTTIPEEAFNNADTGNYICAKCSNNISIRKSNDFTTQILPSVRLIVGEDANRFNTHVEGIKKPVTDKPVIFKCPACGANLEIDGSKRMIECKFCNSKVYLPDDLWFEFHPVKTVDRWYVLLDESGKAEKLPYWYYLPDVAADNSGNIYVASAHEGREDFIVWSFGPDMKTRWVRKDIKYDYDDTGITVTRDDKLLLWNKKKRSLHVLSCSDGSDVTIIKGIDATAENPYPFNLSGCDALLSDSDNTILAIINNTFVRFYNDGSRAPVWKTVSEKGEKPGFFSRLFGGGNSEIKVPSADSDWAPCVKEIGDTPKRVDGDSTKINLGYDNYIYMLDTSSSDGMLAKYSREGEQVWRKLIPLESKECKPYADAKGFVYILGSDNDNKTKLIRFSPDGKKVDVLLNDVLDGGPLSVEELLAVSPDGTIYAFKFYNVLKVFSPDLKIKFESDRSKEEDKEKLADYKKKIEAEE
jgi:DNA-directed RNA polymerase subunit RPC12/RpoP